MDYRQTLSLALDLGTGAPWDVILDRVRELHTAANGSGLPERPCHEITRSRKIHEAHVYRFQGRESYWCPGLSEPGDRLTHGPYTVAYRARTGTGGLRCLEHAPTHPERNLDWMALRADDLDDGGICSVCGRDVLIRGCWCGHEKKAHGSIDMSPVCLHCPGKDARHRPAAERP